MQTILITGGTGLVGNALANALVEKGYQVIILTRDKAGKQPTAGISFALWDVGKRSIDLDALESADHIVHLAGAAVLDKKWTPAYQKEIVDSRVESSALLLSALKDHPNKVRSIISASAIGWYGEDKLPFPNEGFKETTPADCAFLGETCRLWEASIEPAEALGKRVVKLRIGIVLSNDGGAFPEFKRSLRFGIAAILGNGQQAISWIHIEDLCHMFIYTIENKNMHGSYNAVAPGPVTNKSFMLRLAKIARGKFFIPIHVPAFVLKIMLGTRSIEVLKSTTVSCEKITGAGYKFLYPELGQALEDLVQAKDR